MPDNQELNELEQKGDLKDKIHNLKVRLGRQPMDYKTFNDTLGMLEQLTIIRQALDVAEANITAQEISYKEWAAKHAEMYAENKKLQQALDRAVEALEDSIKHLDSDYGYNHIKKNSIYYHKMKAALASIKKGL